VLDLPYVFVADGQQEEMTLQPDFDFGPLLAMFQSFVQSGKADDVVATLMKNCGCAIL